VVTLHCSWGGRLDVKLCDMRAARIGNYGGSRMLAVTRLLPRTWQDVVVEAYVDVDGHVWLHVMPITLPRQSD